MHGALFGQAVAWPNRRDPHPQMCVDTFRAALDVPLLDEGPRAGVLTPAVFFRPSFRFRPDVWSGRNRTLLSQISLKSSSRSYGSADPHVKRGRLVA